MFKVIEQKKEEGKSVKDNEQIISKDPIPPPSQPQPTQDIYDDGVFRQEIKIVG
tara:strand:- start:329 stop:490 length:162 start_codon:yes stop_codon:yes gene_type:complete